MNWEYVQDWLGDWKDWDVTVDEYTIQVHCDAVTLLHIFAPDDECNFEIIDGTLLIYGYINTYEIWKAQHGTER